ncbi:MAG: arylsulfatase [Acidimicrobiales bacterium]|tara:strand:- start:3143 stop:5404 length:2262 start_codon:yes stop_codon:yes gene_type:complete
MTNRAPGPGVTAAESTPSWEPRSTPPSGAPNVVVIVLDDTGFSHLGCFGSDIDTPNIDRLAAGGLRYTNFHTTALCSPTRACLLSGRNHHSVGMRWLSNLDTGFSNCRGVISKSAATLPEVLRANGYGTFAVGKWHLANLEDCSPAGPFDHWPLQRGFNRFHGFLGGATDQFSPELVVDNHAIDPPSEDGYHLSEDMVSQAISMISAQQSSSPGERFFSYVAFGATHSPHQAPSSYIDKYKGKYDEGWDVIRQKWYEKQLDLGIIPSDAELSPRNRGVEPWEELSKEQKALYAKMQEVFAAFLDHTDDQIGRLIQFLETQDLLDDTMIVFLSDNGASQEGGKHGTTNELAYFNLMPLEVNDMLRHLDEIGGPNHYNNYPWGWSQVGNTPLRFYKQNTYEGGIRDPLIIHWPNGIDDAGGIRDQYHHVIDLMPTVLDIVGVEVPETFQGVDQQPVEGTSMSYTFPTNAVDLTTNRPKQYYEMMGHRAIWSDGWKAVTMHRKGVSFEDEKWALYDTSKDFSECHDLSADEPEKLKEMIDLWWGEAESFNVLPLDDRGNELFFMRREDRLPPSKPQRFLQDTPHLERFKIPDVRNRSFEIAAKVTLDGDSEGVLVASGGRTGGIVLYVTDFHLVFEYNFMGSSTILSSKKKLDAGECELGVSYLKTAENHGIASLYIENSDNRVHLGEVEIDTLPYRQTMYGMDVGKDLGPTVSDKYVGPFTFTGDLEWIEFRLENDRDDLVAAAEVEARNALADQ